MSFHVLRIQLGGAAQVFLRQPVVPFVQDFHTQADVSAGQTLSQTLVIRPAPEPLRKDFYSAFVTPVLPRAVSDRKIESFFGRESLQALERDAVKSLCIALQLVDGTQLQVGEDLFRMGVEALFQIGVGRREILPRKRFRAEAARIACPRLRSQEENESDQMSHSAGH